MAQTCSFVLDDDKGDSFRTIQYLFTTLQQKVRTKKTYITHALLSAPKQFSIYDIQTGKIVQTITSVEFEQPINIVHRSTLDGILWARNNTKLHKINLKTNTFKEVQHAKNAFTMLELNNGDLLCETPSSVIVYTPSTNSVKTLFGVNTFLISFLRLRNGDILISHEAKVEHYSADMVHIQSIENSDARLNCNMLLEIEPGIVLGLHKCDNIYKIDTNAKSISVLCTLPNEPYYGVLLDCGNIAVSCQNGSILILNRAGAIVNQINNATKPNDIYALIGQVGPDEIMSLHEKQVIHWCARSGACLKRVPVPANYIFF